ncbi:MAG TPA: gliding motility-associated C-terminal domain-containing protein [Puia sp.]|jgi:gliding motility-associated-like protein|nr:gliding motility-associated C-terminal domain-containing protein [Puia sp.]
MRKIYPVLLLLIAQSAYSQSQVCPLNSNWSLDNLTHWWAYTGNNAGGNGPGAIKETFDSTIGPPTGTLGTQMIQEYNLPSVTGIQVLAASTIDPYGGFPTIPTINGYKYTNTMKLGSTSITRASGPTLGGGYVRGVSYRINVPPGPITEPYTMTYAYAMVLENGTHNSNDQPMFQATLTAGDSVVTCASPKYYLPTLNNGGQQDAGATLDSVLAESEGFKLSLTASPNSDPNGGPGAPHLLDVWYKTWTEVTFDLSAYRGTQVVLTFETDNCVPGGHFAYSYIALRNVCAGLQISGDTSACIGSTLSYSVPGLTGASYLWTVPGDWSITSGEDSSIMKVMVGNDPGTVVVNERNSCANLNATTNVKTVQPTAAGAVSGGMEVCTGVNSVTLTTAGNRGSVVGWLATSGGVTTPLNDTTSQYTAQNLTATTLYQALIQNGESCLVDTTSGSTVLVDPRSVGGTLNPATLQFCEGQTKDALLQVQGDTGRPVNWQTSTDGVNWTSFVPADTASVYNVIGLAVPTDFRVIVESGVCPADTSSVAEVTYVNVPFPQAAYQPADTLVCYNTPAYLNAVITIGTNYAWSNTGTLTGVGNDIVTSLPYTMNVVATPKQTTDYVLTVENAGCPNLLLDTFHVRVLPPIIVNPGNDTSVVIGEPLQLSATSNDTTTPGGDSFAWTPIIGLNNPNIYDPVAIFTGETDSVRYIVTATSKYGCAGTGEILVKVFKTGPDIFVPNAFTPGGRSNDVFRPVPVGIKSLAFFRVYNRWGELVYSTTRIGDGWDGRINGHLQESGTYVWTVEGTTYTGRIVFHKGTMILVR